MRREDIRIRDPFVLAEDGTYYLYGSTDPHIWSGDCRTFAVYVSRDLQEFSPPVPVFTRPDGFWSEEQYWAPEVHTYRGRYYLFAAFHSPAEGRRCQILRADSPLGPFLPFAEPFTPAGWDCLDATLWVEEGVPYAVFCHEWVQIVDGTVEVVPLEKDLSGAAGEPTTLFRASEAPWTRATSFVGKFDGYITDGPFLHRLPSGKLAMIWSSCVEKSVYAVGMAVSDSGSVRGPYRHLEQPLFRADGGHGCLFRGPRDELLLALHAPNAVGAERPCFLAVEETEDGLRLI